MQPLDPSLRGTTACRARAPIAGLCGLIRFDGGPVDPGDFEAMRRSLCAGGAIRTAESIGQSAALGTVAFRATETSDVAGQFRQDPSGAVIAVAARLDYRDDLCAELTLPASSASVMTDDELVRAAYAKWGRDCPRHLFGDWAFAAWSARERSLFLARDRVGNTSLFYAFRPPLLAFASTSNALVAMPGWRFAMDEWILARYLTIFPPPADQFGQTIWRDIGVMLPAETMSVDARTLRRQTYWTVATVERVRPSDGEDWVDGFLHHFRAAVASRVSGDGAVGTTLSSGLDSGAVTALAAQSLADSVRGLTAFTSVPVHRAEHLVPGARADEWPLAAIVAARHPNIVHVPIRSESTTPLAGIRQALSMYGVPQHAAGNEFWIMDLYREAQRRGISKLLTGQLGNGGVSWSGGSYVAVDLLANGRWLECVEMMRRWKGYNRTSWYRALRRHLLGPLLKPIWHQRRRVRRRGAEVWEAYAAIRPEFATRIGLSEAMRAQTHDPTFFRPLTPLQERWGTVWMNGAVAGPIYHPTALATGVQALDPTGDARLLDYCFGVPASEDVYDGGERMLIRRAMEGLLPPEVQWNVVRGSQAADVSYRLLDYPGEMEDALATVNGSSAANQYLDIAALKKAWANLRQSVTPETHRGASVLLLRGLMAGLFLAGIEDAGGGSYCAAAPRPA